MTSEQAYGIILSEGDHLHRMPRHQHATPPAAAKTNPSRIDPAARWNRIRTLHHRSTGDAGTEPEKGRDPMSDHIPGAIPRACDCTYRGNLAAKPQVREKDGRKFVTARIGVNMAARTYPARSRTS